MTPKLALYDALPLVMQGYSARLSTWEVDREIYLNEDGTIHLRSHNGELGQWEPHPSTLVATDWIVE